MYTATNRHRRLPTRWGHLHRLPRCAATFFFFLCMSLLMFFGGTNGRDSKQEHYQHVRTKGLTPPQHRLQGHSASWNRDTAPTTDISGWHVLPGIDDNDDKDDDDNSKQEGPATRYGHSMMTVSLWNEFDLRDHEYLIITGGFSAFDDKSFPVWAYEIAMPNEDLWQQMSSSTMYQWTLLSPGEADSAFKSENDERQNVIPPPRMNHLSAVLDKYLYVWGGATNSGQVADSIPYIWRTDLGHLQKIQFGTKEITTPLKWERLVPNILAESGMYGGWEDRDDGMECRLSDPTSIRDESDEDYSIEENNEEVNRFWDDILSSINSTSFAVGRENEEMSVISPKDVLHLSREGARGGMWAGYHTMGNPSFFVMFGGRSINPHYPRNILELRTGEEDVLLGDVWSLHLPTCTFRQLLAHRNEADFPAKRSGHGATVLFNDDLVVYGGYTRPNGPLMESADPAKSVVLGDYWKLHLGEFFERGPRWEAGHVPSVPRMGHTLVESSNRRIVVFGGCVVRNGDELLTLIERNFFCDGDVATADTVVIEERGYAFSMTEASEHDHDHVPPSRSNHAASTDGFGRVYIWGGRIPFWEMGVDSPVWTLDPLAYGGPGSRIHDDADYGLTTGAVIADFFVIFGAIAFAISICVMGMTLIGRMQSEQERMGVPGAVDVDTGLSPREIEALPMRVFSSIPTTTNNDEDVCITCAPPSSLSSPVVALATPTAQSGNNEEDGCAICLLEYSPGDRIRRLPCDHEFHEQCVASWLKNRPSCPSCRQAVRRGDRYRGNNNESDHSDDVHNHGGIELAQFVSSWFRRGAPNDENGTLTLSSAEMSSVTAPQEESLERSEETTATTPATVDEGSGEAGHLLQQQHNNDAAGSMSYRRRGQLLAMLLGRGFSRGDDSNDSFDGGDDEDADDDNDEGILTTEMVPIRA